MLHTFLYEVVGAMVCLKNEVKKFVLLKSPKYSVVDQRFTRQKIKFLEEIVKNYKDISIIPVSIFGVTDQIRNNPFLKLFFHPLGNLLVLLRKFSNF